ncbi:MAG TPA: hypothetical protein PKX07_07505 [Aggregatilineales bacterium]|nr:hypothetical protein [Aggregatilineales bacterium]
MRRYVFSQGKVRVEEGIYRPVLNRTKPKHRGGVLLIIKVIAPPPEAHETTAHQQTESRED